MPLNDHKLKQAASEKDMNHQADNGLTVAKTFAKVVKVDAPTKTNRQMTDWMQVNRRKGNQRPETVVNMHGTRNQARQKSRRNVITGSAKSFRLQGIPKAPHRKLANIFATPFDPQVTLMQ